MPGWLVRILAMAAKELRVVLLDRRVLTTLVLSPIIQLILFGFATTLEVRNVAVGVVNRDSGVASERFLAAVAASPSVARLVAYPDERSLQGAIERREILAGLRLPPDLSQRLARGENGEIGLILDGRRINAAQVLAGYIGQIAQTTGAELAPGRTLAQPRLAPVNLYNPNLEYSWFTLPGLVTLVSAVLMMSVAAQAMAREREFGTFDQLMVLPMRYWEIIAGKAAPAFSVGLFNASLCTLAIPLMSDVPLRGSPVLLGLSIVAFAFAITGLGLCVSVLARNQQQAFLGGFLVTVPMILLSGYASPVDAMPGWLQAAARIDPLGHMLQLCHGLFLKDLPAELVWPHVKVLLGIGIGAYFAATALLRWRSG